jgi:hypothetical protein
VNPEPVNAYVKYYQINALLTKMQDEAYGSGPLVAFHVSGWSEQRTAEPQNIE